MSDDILSTTVANAGEIVTALRSIYEQPVDDIDEDTCKQANLILDLFQERFDSTRGHLVEYAEALDVLIHSRSITSILCAALLMRHAYLLRETRVGATPEINPEKLN